MSEYLALAGQSPGTPCSSAVVPTAMLKTDNFSAEQDLWRMQVSAEGACCGGSLQARDFCASG